MDKLMCEGGIMVGVQHVEDVDRFLESLEDN